MGALSHVLRQAIVELFDGKQNKMAERADISAPNLNRYCSGSVRPERYHMEKICKVLPDEWRARVAVAHMLDECPPSALYLVRCEPTPSMDVPKLREFTSSREFEMLDDETKDAIMTLVRVSIQYPAAREAMISTAKMLASTRETPTRETKQETKRRPSKVRGRQVNSSELSEAAKAAERALAAGRHRRP